MRILIVTATKPGSSRAPAEAFVRHVKEAFKKALRAHEKVEFIVRQHTELLEFLPPPPVPPAEADITASKYCIAAFDGLDFIFVDGDEQWLPWVPEVAQAANPSPNPNPDPDPDPDPDPSANPHPSRDQVAPLLKLRTLAPTNPNPDPNTDTDPDPSRNPNPNPNPKVAPLLKLLHLSALSHKCVFGCGC